MGADTQNPDAQNSNTQNVSTQDIIPQPNYTKDDQIENAKSYLEVVKG